MSKNIYKVQPGNDGTYDVIQSDTGIIIAGGAGLISAQRVVNTINVCPFIARLGPPAATYQPFFKDCGSPTGVHNYFLIRQRGIHSATRKKYIPVTMQLIDDQLYSHDNEIEPTAWSSNGDFTQGLTTDPYRADLEWMPCPE